MSGLWTRTLGLTAIKSMECGRLLQPLLHQRGESTTDINQQLCWDRLLPAVSKFNKYTDEKDSLQVGYSDTPWVLHGAFLQQ